ncbi:hypothetical protein E2542_SST11771 [Spatholobus suberectus]|nr:hypothetical protein E2542_SST11771 [Spatholobus suberectus]
MWFSAYFHVLQTSDSNSCFVIAGVEILLPSGLNLNGTYCEFVSPPFPPSLLYYHQISPLLIRLYEALKFKIKNKKLGFCILFFIIGSLATLMYIKLLIIFTSAICELECLNHQH